MKLLGMNKKSGGEGRKSKSKVVRKIKQKSIQKKKNSRRMAEKKLNALFQMPPSPPKSGHHKTHAPRLHASAKKLEKQMKMDKLNKSLGRRPDKKELLNGTFITSFFQNVLRNHAAASALERCLKKDAVHLNLRTRPSKGHLYRSGVLNREHRNIAPSVAGVAKKDGA